MTVTRPSQSQLPNQAAISADNQTLVLQTSTSPVQDSARSAVISEPKPITTPLEETHTTSLVALDLNQIVQGPSTRPRDSRQLRLGRGARSHDLRADLEQLAGTIVPGISKADVPVGGEELEPGALAKTVDALAGPEEEFDRAAVGVGGDVGEL